MSDSQGGRLPILRLGGLTAAALVIHGYHLGVEDAEIYIPTAKKLLHPGLYPYADEFFLSHGHLSLFGPILAWTSRLTHLPIDWSILTWYILTLFAMLAACWLLLKACFHSPRAHWTGIAAEDIRKLALEYATVKPSVIRLNYFVKVPFRAPNS